MARIRSSVLNRLSEAARFLGVHSWILAVVGIPVALLLHSGTAAVLILLLALTWQVVSLLALGVVRRRSAETRSRYGIRFTQWGRVYSVITIIFCVVANQWGVNLLSLTAAFLLGGLLCSLVLTFAALAGITLRWRLPSHVFAGDAFPVTVNMKNDKRLLGAYGIRAGSGAYNSSPPQERHCIWSLPPGEERSLTMRQSLPRRGSQALPPLELRSGFPFGLLEIVVSMGRKKEVLVLPHVGRIREDVLIREQTDEAPWLRSLRTKDLHGEFRSLREYRPGDDPRLIHWKTSARLGALFVREFERQRVESVLLLLDASLPPQSPPARRERIERFERAVSFTGTLASMLESKEILYAFVSFCPEMVSLPYRCGRRHLFDLLEALALAEPTETHSLSDLMATLTPREDGGGACLITPGLPRAPRPRPSVVTIDVSNPDFDELFTAKV